MRVQFLLFCFLLILSSAFSQNKFEFGERLNYNAQNIIISFDKPLAFSESKSGFGATDSKNLVTSFINYDIQSILQVYCTPIPSQFAMDAELFFSDKNNIEQIMKQTFPEPINYVNSYKVIKINGRNFLEVNVTSYAIQKQTNWITFYKNNFINILGTTTIDNFKNIIEFLDKFKSSILID